MCILLSLKPFSQQPERFPCCMFLLLFLCLSIPLIPRKNSYLFLNKNFLPLSHFSCFIDSCNICFLFLFSDLYFYFKQEIQYNTTATFKTNVWTDTWSILTRVETRFVSLHTTCSTIPYAIVTISVTVKQDKFQLDFSKSISLAKAFPTMCKFLVQFCDIYNYTSCKNVKWTLHRVTGIIDLKSVWRWLVCFMLLPFC